MPPSYEAWDAARATAVLAAHAKADGGLLPALHELQSLFGYVPDAAVKLAAEAFNRSRAEIHGVVTFYHDFRRVPPGVHVVKVCRAEACQAVGCESLVTAVEAHLHTPCGSTTSDGRVTFEPVYCLGLCASGPSALIDGHPVARLTSEKLIARLKEVGA